MSKKHVNNFRGDVYFTPNEKMNIKDEPLTPVEDEGFGDHNQLDLDYPDNDFEPYGSMRKSMSMNDIAFLRANVKMEYERSDNSRMERPSGHLDLECSRTKFVSMAEAIYHFQRDTPSRFHSTRPQKFRSTSVTGRLPLTMPQSPMLRCKARSRPPHVMSQQEKEELELEEIRKHKIKAQPIPKSIIEGTRNLPDVPRKPNTVPEPFNLTEMHKKLVESPEQKTTFKARPAPRHVLEKPFVPVKPLVQLTAPISPKFHYKKPNSDKYKHNHVEVLTDKTDKSSVRTGPVRPEPFSFEKRDEELKRRKEDKIKRQIEEERMKASSFKAHPLPGVIKKHMAVTASKASSSSTSSENKENHTKFEARPATVLYKEPFKPLLQMHYVKPAPFALSTEKRAAEREIFDRQLKEKEERQERMRQQREKELKELEEKAQAELRATLVHHPKPPPAFDVFVPEKSSIPLTVPETPKFVRRLNQR